MDYRFDNNILYKYKVKWNHQMPLILNNSIIE